MENNCENYVEINSNFQKIINNLQYVVDIINSNANKDKLPEMIVDCVKIIRQVGSKSLLSEDAELFNNITTDLLKTYIKKNHDYGNSFEQSLDKFGLVAGIVRIGDKMNRIETLTTKKALVEDESIKDTLLDMANYCILTTMWINKNSK